MIKIGLLSDTHGYLDDQILTLLKDCDEIWHAGDLGGVLVLDKLKSTSKKVRVVFGNIDDAKTRLETHEILEWELEGKKFLMTHIGGYPGHYAKGIKDLLIRSSPDVFICGHSHILKVMMDKALNILHLNPGACGKTGFHQVRTLLKFSIDKGQLKEMAVVELGVK